LASSLKAQSFWTLIRIIVNIYHILFMQYLGYRLLLLSFNLVCYNNSGCLLLLLLLVWFEKLVYGCNTTCTGNWVRLLLLLLGICLCLRLMLLLRSFWLLKMSLLLLLLSLLDHWSEWRLILDILDEGVEVIWFFARSALKDLVQFNKLLVCIVLKAVYNLLGTLKWQFDWNLVK